MGLLQARLHCSTNASNGGPRNRHATDFPARTDQADAGPTVPSPRIGTEQHGSNRFLPTGRSDGRRRAGTPTKRSTVCSNRVLPAPIRVFPRQTSVCHGWARKKHGCNRPITTQRLLEALTSPTAEDNQREVALGPPAYPASNIGCIRSIRVHPWLKHHGSTVLPLKRKKHRLKFPRASGPHPHSSA